MGTMYRLVEWPESQEYIGQEGVLTPMEIEAAALVPIETVPIETDENGVDENRHR